MKVGDFKYGAKVGCINSPTMDLKFAWETYSPRTTSVSRYLSFMVLSLKNRDAVYQLGKLEILGLHQKKRNMGMFLQLYQQIPRLEHWNECKTIP